MKDFFRSLMGLGQNTSAQDHVQLTNDELEFRSTQTKTGSKDWTAEFDNMMPQPSGRERHEDGLNWIRYSLGHAHFALITRSLTTAWTQHPDLGNFINGFRLLKTPIKDGAGRLVANFEIWVVYDAGASYPHIQTQEYWIRRGADGKLTTTWAEFKQQPLDYPVVIPQILKIFEDTIRLGSRMDLLAKGIVQWTRDNPGSVSSTEERDYLAALANMAKAGR